MVALASGLSGWIERKQASLQVVSSNTYYYKEDNYKFNWQNCLKCEVTRGQKISENSDMGIEKRRIVFYVETAESFKNSHPKKLLNK
jgi:hypothetical protein